MKYTEAKHTMNEMEREIAQHGIEGSFLRLFPGQSIEHLNGSRTESLPLDNDPRFVIFCHASMLAASNPCLIPKATLQRIRKNGLHGTILIEEVSVWNHHTTSKKGLANFRRDFATFEEKYGMKPRTITEIMENLSQKEREILEKEFQMTEAEREAFSKREEPGYRMDSSEVVTQRRINDEEEFPSAFRSSMRIELGIDE